MLDSHRRFSGLSAFAAFLTVLGLLGGAQMKFWPASAQAAIAFVQVNSATPQANSATVAVKYNSAQTAGDLNVVVVGWNDAVAQVQSVVDTSGNLYQLAVGPTVRSGSATQSIYYAANIAGAAAGANTVTVTFSQAAVFADVRIAEYRGIATVNPVDVAVGASGSSTSSNSGSITTTNANDLIIGANVVQTVTTGAGTSFTSRIITNPDADIFEDRIVTATGSYSATAPISPTGWWVMQLVAFRAASSDTQAPSAPGTPVLTVVSDTQINLTWPAATDNVAVTGYFVERCAGAACSTFSQVATPTTTSFNNTGLAPATSYTYRVRATDAAGNLGPYSTTASAATLADTQPPTTPGTPVLTVVSSTQINLTWSASTDDVGVTGYFVERCAGTGCSTFAQVGSPTATSFSDAGLTQSTTYSYRVRAKDAANNLGPYSAISSGTTPSTADTQPPTAPGTPVPTVVSSTQINLTWPAATDNVAVTGYFVERCAGANCTTFVQVGSPATTSFSDTGLSPSTTYNYRVRATDAANNLGPYSSTAGATTQAAPDTQAPTAPGTPVLTVVSSSQINVTWPAATDNVAVTGYFVERCAGASCSTFAQIGAPTGTSFNDTGVSASTSYSYRVRATDAASNLGPYSATASATTPAAAAIAFVQTASATPQTAQTSVAVTFAQAQSAGNLNVVVVGWNSSTGQVQSVGDTKGNTYVLGVGPTVSSGFATQSIYYAANIAAAAAGTNAVTVTFSAAAAFPDIRIAEYRGIATTNPVDGAIASTGSSTTTSSGSLTTTNANDLLVAANIVQTMTTAAGTGFTSRVITVPDADILEDQIVTATGTYSATAPVSPSGAWIMQMVAFRAAGSVVDTQPPSAPTGLVATAVSQSQINLLWTASTDNVGVAGYRIERCASAGCSNFAEIAAPLGTATSFSDTNSLAASSSYSYRVRAIDGAGNLGPYSNTSSATTLSPDTTPPSAPGVLTLTVISGIEIDLSWGAATDNVGVAGYRIDRCQGVGCTTFSKFGTLVQGTSLADTSLSANTSYSYQVAAQDAAGNLGPYTNIATATTSGANPSLVAAYAFSEGSGATVTDLSGHGNNGTINNATWTTSGKFGNALNFNGSNAFVNITDSSSLHLTTAMTLEAWVNPTAISAVWRDIIYKGNDNYYLEASTTSGGLPAGAGTFGSADVAAYGAATLPLNMWSHLATTYDGTTIRLYLNGTQVGSLAQTGAIATSTTPLTLGGDTIYGQFFQGTIDEVRIYNTVLTPAQIQADMSAPLSGSFPQISLSTVSLTFASQSQGSTSAPMPVTVTNTGNVALTIGGLSITGPQSTDFAQTNTCGAPVAPNGSCTINVTFTPSSGGSRTATLVISDNAPGTPHSVALSGTGAGLSISPRTVVVVSSHSTPFTTAGGTGTVTWSVDNIAGGSAAVGTITAGGVYTAPTAVGTHTVTASASGQFSSATIYIANNAGMFTHHNDKARTGQNLTETILTTANVNSSTFGKVATFATDGISHASPLYVANVNIPSVGIRNVVYVSTEHDSVYAFDADGVNGAAPLWHVSFINPGAGITTVPNGDTGECCDITPEIGITGTPVIDPSSNTLYVVGKTKEGSNTYVQRLHALDLATGAEKFGGPVVIQASVPGTGVGSSGNTLAFNALRENQRTALLLQNGIIYMGFGSHGDNEPYHGWLLGYNATTLQQVLVWCPTPNQEGGGIWLSGGGLVVDSSGNFFFATGDGEFTVNTGGVDYGDSFIRFNPTGPNGSVADYFTPHDEGTLNTNNLDLDAGGMILLPDQTGAHPHLLVSAGKSGSIYLVDRDNMTHFNTADRNPQTLVNIFPFGTPLPGNYSSPVYYNGTVYFGPVADVLQAFQLNNGLLTTAPTSTSPEAYPYPGGALAISANGNTNGILWAVWKNGTANGALRAYDATNLSFELYNSDQATGGRDTLDVAAKFAIPLVVNGKVFVASNSKLTVFGLLP